MCLDGRPVNFNPRPRKEGDPHSNLAAISIAISIHALVKRATDYTKARYNKDNISIHALVKRATHQHTPLFKADLISIHALVKRATIARLDGGILKFNFNPRPRKEGDSFH